MNTTQRTTSSQGDVLSGTLDFVSSGASLQPMVPSAADVASANPKMQHKNVEVIAEIKGFSLNTEINPMGEVEKHQEKLSMYKANIPPLKLFFLGCLAGWWVGLAAILSCTIAGGMPPEIRKAWPMLPKLITGFLFPVAIFFITLFGGELFTGNAMVMMIGLFARRVTFLELMYNWSMVLVSNFAGCVATVYFFGYLTHLFDDEPLHSYITGVADYKIHLAPEVTFLRAVTANALVCTCVLFGLSARDMTGKIVGMWFPIMTFASSGFEHAIANMAYVPLGLMYGAHSDYRVWLYQNFIIAVLGNIVGGGFIMGSAQYFLYDWTKVLAKLQGQQVELAKTDEEHARDHKSNSTCAGHDGPSDSSGKYLTPGEEDRFRRVFKNFDGDQDGAINAAELMCVLHVLGFTCSKAIADGMMQSHSEQEGRGVLNWEGFIGVMHRMKDLQHLGLKECA